MNTITDSKNKPVLRIGIALILSLLLLNPAPTLGAFTASSTSSGAKIPVGQLTDMMHIKVSSTSDTVLSKMTIKNTSPLLNFGKGITEVRVYKSSGGSFTGTETPLVTETYSTPQPVGLSKDLEFSDLIPSGNTQTYIVAYTFSESAALDVTSNLTLLYVTDSNGSNATLTTSPYTFTSTGFRKIVSKSVLPSVVVPGQSKVAVMALSIQAAGESAGKNFALKISNLGNNFVTSSGSKNGITAVYLYDDPGNSGVPLDTYFTNSSLFLASVSAGEFTANNEVTLSIPNPAIQSFLAQDTTANFFVVFDIGSDFTITSNTKVQAQITSLKATGSESSRFLLSTQKYPVQSVSAAVAGLAYSNLSKISTNGNFGPGTAAPILQFDLTGYQADMKLSTVNIRNNGTVQFATSTTQLDRVSAVSVYLDDGNATFDGIGSKDTLVGKKTLGVNNQIDSVEIPVSLNATSILISSFNANATGYPLNHTKQFYVVYHFGESVSNGTAKAQLLDARGKAVVDSFTEKAIKLSGTLPAEPTPAASIDLKNTNVYISSIAIVTPTPNTVIRGQIKVPMLYITLNSKDSVASTSITIKNDSNTFFTNSSGVNKVWLYSDEAPLGTFGAEDKFLSSNDRLINATSATLGSVPIYSGVNRMWVLYDIGQVADIRASSIRAQLASLASSAGSTSILLGGEVPSPKEPAIVSIANKNLSLSGVFTNLSAQNGLSQSTDFEMTLTNSSGSSISINDMRPRFYLNSISGKDISYQFQISANATTSFNIPANGTKTITYTVKHLSPATKGSVIVDGYVLYKTSNGLSAVLSRYPTNAEWLSALSSPPSVEIQTVNTTYNWSLPEYISSLKILSGNIQYPFGNFNTIPEGSSLLITLRDKSIIDETSLKISLRDVPLSKLDSTNSSSSGYSYNSSTGLITVAGLGSTNGNLLISLKDLEGTQLTPAQISFLISSDLKITDLYFYPSPYRIGGGTALLLGMNATQSANIRIYVYNMLGQEVWNGETSISNIGYQTVPPAKMQDLMAALSPGMYICQVVATDISTGKVTRAATRLSVY